MGIFLLIDEFEGNPEELYNLVVEEVNRRAIPGVEFSWGQEGEKVKLLSLGGAVKVLRVSFRGEYFHVVAHQIGRCFHVSARVAVGATADPKAGFLHDISMACFEQVVKRATRTALKRHLEARNAPIPEDLDPREIFFTPSRASVA